MADKVVTATNVIPGPAAVFYYGNADTGVTIAAGDQVYVSDTTNHILRLADSNGTPPANSVKGTAINGGGPGQRIQVVTFDDAFQPGYPVASGETVCLSATPGKSCPDADVVSGMTKVILAAGIGSNKVKYEPISAGAVP